MNFRQLAGYPPAGTLAALHLSGADPAHLDLACAYLGRFAKQAAARAGVEVLGPADETISKVQDIYRKVLYLKGRDRRPVQAVRRQLERYIEANEGFSSLTIQFEVQGG